MAKTDRGRRKQRKPPKRPQTGSSKQRRPPELPYAQSWDEFGQDWFYFPSRELYARYKEAFLQDLRGIDKNKIWGKAVELYYVNPLREPSAIEPILDNGSWVDIYQGSTTFMWDNAIVMGQRPKITLMPCILATPYLYYLMNIYSLCTPKIGYAIMHEMCHHASFLSQEPWTTTPIKSPGLALGLFLHTVSALELHPEHAQDLPVFGEIMEKVPNSGKLLGPISEVAAIWGEYKLGKEIFGIDPAEQEKLRFEVAKSTIRKMQFLGKDSMALSEAIQENDENLHNVLPLIHKGLPDLHNFIKTKFKEITSLSTEEFLEKVFQNYDLEILTGDHVSDYILKKYTSLGKSVSEDIRNAFK